MWEVSVNFSGMRGLCRNFSPMYQPGDVHSGPARARYTRTQASRGYPPGTTTWGCPPGPPRNSGPGSGQPGTFRGTSRPPIASDFKARLDITEYSFFKDCDIEDAERLIGTAITNSIKTRIPRYEPLEWYIESGVNGEGREWYTAYVLVRFPRKIFWMW